VSNDWIIVNDEMERMYMKRMPNVGYYPRIQHDRMMKTTKTLISQRPARYKLGTSSIQVRSITNGAT